MWKARDIRLDRVVAVKIPRSPFAQRDDGEQFLREARAAAQLHHPNIVGVHQVGNDGQSVYIVSDFVEGRSLDDWREGSQPSQRQAAVMCKTLATALHYAHEHGVVHRDLKPANIMVDFDGSRT